MTTPVYANQNLMLGQLAARTPADYFSQALPNSLQYQQSQELLPYRKDLLEAESKEAQAKAANAEMTQKIYSQMISPGSSPYQSSSGMKYKPEDIFAHKVLGVPGSVVWPDAENRTMRQVVLPDGRTVWKVPDPGELAERTPMGPKVLGQWDEGDQHITQLQHPDGTVEIKRAPRYKPVDQTGMTMKLQQRLSKIAETRANLRRGMVPLDFKEQFVGMAGLFQMNKVSEEDMKQWEMAARQEEAWIRSHLQSQGIQQPEMPAGPMGGGGGASGYINKHRQGQKPQ